MVFFISWLLSLWRKWFRRGITDEQNSSSNLFISFKTIQTATNGFSDQNLLGQGGFGPVYKGVLADGGQIAVKKLSLSSRQGVLEFTNEVSILLKVQHRNLVSLLGCCVEGDDKMLIYELLPNRSLDLILFDKKKSFTLHWSKRLEIITGIVKGLLYLHEESPVKIIHRDIKASNILLDGNMNPKISDFGMARLFEDDDTHVNTFRISGTYGYMAPEYATKGYMSAKTDVFSFGIMVLEILSGRKNLDRLLDDDLYDLLGYTWKVYQQGKMFDIMDTSLADWDAGEAALCIQIGLLCCQEIIADRPDMLTVHIMLSSESFTLPKLGRPGTRGRSYPRQSEINDASDGNNCTTSSSSQTTRQPTSGTVSSGEDCTRASITISLTGR
ncbi:receptor kinase 2 [Zostera marina]|uniref:Receptor kinase 2 n=1 Tax=Zostera marina TaxID=29655 RepID=A0A0K9PU32_ZOSMR|nr:receptor kinase 2 [Zostera marina]